MKSNGIRGTQLACINLVTAKRLTTVRSIRIVLLMIGLICMQCGSNRKECYEVTAINEYQDCDNTDGVFYKITGIKGYDELKDSIVLFEISDDLKSKRNYYSLLWRGPERKNRLKILVQGYFLKKRGPLDDSYGCDGSGHFMITDVLKIEDVTHTETFPLTYDETVPVDNEQK